MGRGGRVWDCPAGMVAAVSPAMNADGLDLLWHLGNWHFLLSSPMLGVLRACNDLRSFCLRLNEFEVCPTLLWLKAENTEE